MRYKSRYQTHLNHLRKLKSFYNLQVFNQKELKNPFLLMSNFPDIQMISEGLWHMLYVRKLTSSISHLYWFWDELLDQSQVDEQFGALTLNQHEGTDPLQRVSVYKQVFSLSKLLLFSVKILNVCSHMRRKNAVDPFKFDHRSFNMRNLLKLSNRSMKAKFRFVV